MNDSGKRDNFYTGAEKESVSKGKGAYHLIPQHPIRKLAEIYQLGAEKYSERNWELGIPLSRSLDSAYRHLSKFSEGMADEDHLHQAIWNLFAISYTLEMIDRGLIDPKLDDLPIYGYNGIEVRVDENTVCKKWRRKKHGN